MGVFGAGLMGEEESPVKSLKDQSKITTDKGQRILRNVEGKSNIHVLVSPKVKKITFKEPSEKLEDSGFFPEPVGGRKMDRHELKKSQKTAEQRLKAEYGFESDDGADEFSASDED